MTPADLYTRAAFVEALRPSAPTLSLVLAELERVGERDLACEIAATLTRIVDRLGSPEPRVTFGGHVSCGKSTLVNALLGRALLPTGDLPETGAPCVIRGTAGENMAVRTMDGIVTAVPFGDGSIAQAVRLIAEDGSYRAQVHHTRALLVELSGALPPTGVCWVDSPGIDDTTQMNERAAFVAADSDLLVWIIDSRRPLAESEQEFLTEHIATHGPAAVSFVVNAFLPETDSAHWERFGARRTAAHLARVHDAALTTPLPPTVAVASAAGMAIDAVAFGADAVAAVLQPTPARIALTRLSRARSRLRELADDLDDRSRHESRRIADIARARTQEFEAGRQRRAAFARAMSFAVDSVLADGLRQIDAVFRAFSPTSRNAFDNNNFGYHMAPRMAAVTDHCAAVLAGQAVMLAARHGLSGYPPGLSTTLAGILRLWGRAPRHWPIGTESSRDTAAERVRIESARLELTAELSERRDTVVDALLRSGAAPAPRPPLPDEQRLTALRATLDCIVETVMGEVEFEYQQAFVEVSR